MRDRSLTDGVRDGQPAVTATSRLLRAVQSEIQWIRPRLWAMHMLARLLPDGVGPRMRTEIYRRFGIRIGQGTLIFGPIRFGWYGEPFRNLVLGARCFVNREVFVDATARVTIG